MGESVNQTAAQNARSRLSGLENGQKLNTKQCAQFANGLLRNSGYKIYGNAWNQNNLTPIINGYEIVELNNESPYNEKQYHELSRQAAKAIYDNFDTSELDTNQVFIVNMYHPSSPYKKEAYTDSENGQYGTHTGVLFYPEGESGRSNGKHGARQWRVAHNIGGTVYVEPFSDLQYAGGEPQFTGSYVTSLSVPKKKSTLDKAKDWLYSIFSKREGGILVPKSKYRKYQKRRV